jgi:hypothetical protein
MLFLKNTGPDLVLQLSLSFCQLLPFVMFVLLCKKMSLTPWGRGINIVNIACSNTNNNRVLTTDLTRKRDQYSMRGMNTVDRYERNLNIYCVIQVWLRREVVCGVALQGSGRWGFHWRDPVFNHMWSWMGWQSRGTPGNFGGIIE